MEADKDEEESLYHTPIVLPQHQQQHELNFYTDISPDKNASSSASLHIILFLM